MEESKRKEESERKEETESERICKVLLNQPDDFLYM